jgi:hypothetical protein
MVSISILYEQQWPPHNMQSQSLRHTQALMYYDAAMRALRSVRDETVVLLTCILFVCIEFLLGSPQLATDHCRHGILMLNAYGDASTVARQVLAPIYTRMSIFPYFFGSTVSTFPPILGPSLQMQEDFYSFRDAQQSLDELLSQSVRFVRKAGEHRSGRLMHSAIPSKLRREQNVLQALLERWNSVLQRFMIKETTQKAYYALQIRYLVAKIWTSTALDRSELAFDRHWDHFRIIRDFAAELVDSESAESGRRTRASFTFDMGFLPLLYFVVIKCRKLKLRTSALSLMVELAAEKEGLWDVDTMSVVGTRIIEIEHGVSLTNGDSDLTHIELLSVLPAESRVWDSMLGPETCSLNEQGNLIRERKATFLFQASNGEFVRQNERLFFCHT